MSPRRAPGFRRSRGLSCDPDFSDVPVAGLTDPCYAKDSKRPSIAARVIQQDREGGTPHTCAHPGQQRTNNREF